MTQTEAKDELYGLLQAVWSQAAAGVDPLPVIVWPGEPVPAPDASFIFSTPNVEVVTKGQATLRRTQDQSLFEANVLFSLSIFAPKSNVGALRQAELLGEAVEESFSKASPSGDIWFRNAKSGQVGGTATQNQVNVVVTCSYRNQQ